jgi:hypothetical protein
MQRVHTRYVSTTTQRLTRSQLKTRNLDNPTPLLQSFTHVIFNIIIPFWFPLQFHQQLYRRCTTTTISVQRHELDHHPISTHNLQPA